MHPAVPVLRDLVLVGGGHSHVTVLKQFGMSPMAGVRLTLITSAIHTPYSGMLPGYISGFYTYDDVHIDLSRLARFAGARLVHAEAQGLDTQGQRVLLHDRPPLPYDVVSLNLGITPALSTVPGAADFTTPVKPISGVVARFEALLNKATTVDLPLRVAVVGGGASGVELACALQYRLSQERHRAGFTSELVVHVISRVPILSGLNPYARRAFLPLLRERGIALYEVSGGVVEVQPSALLLADGQRISFDECLWSTQASAAGWLADTGLPTDSDGFLLVDDFLRSDGGPPNVFAAGDVASNSSHPRPKAGVFAVRAGPPLAENLRHALLGQALQPWIPQKSFLSLITAGDKYAVATKSWLGMQGGWLWAWKDWIDRAFMAKFGADLDFATMEQLRSSQSPHQLPHALERGLSAEELALLAAAKMRCGGCGSKVGATSLGLVLQRLQDMGCQRANAQQQAVLIGLDEPDDAAVLEPPPPGHVMVQTVDFFRTMVSDPYLFGQIAANHALSDCHAMGAAPMAALAVAVVPLATAASMEEDLVQMLAGALSTLHAAGCALVGGHSSEGAELAVGFAVSGSVPREEILSKRGMEPGLAVIITKPVGTGILLAAEMRGGSKGRWMEAAVECMKQSNGPAVAVLRAHGVTACTDVTGFGVLGHLAEMARASKVVVSLDAAAVPVLEGALQCACDGFRSSLHRDNATVAAVLEGGPDSLEAGLFAVLVDPQTAGGLLASVPAEEAERCVAALKNAGYPHAAVVGRTNALPSGSTACLRLGG